MRLYDTRSIWFEIGAPLWSDNVMNNWVQKERFLVFLDDVTIKWIVFSFYLGSTAVVMNEILFLFA